MVYWERQFGISSTFNFKREIRTDTGAEKSGAKICSKSEQDGIADSFPEQNRSRNWFASTPAFFKTSGQMEESCFRSTEMEIPSEYPRGNIMAEFAQQAILCAVTSPAPK